MWPPSISLGMFASLVRYVALIMFFNFSIFQSQPLCSSHSGLMFNNFLQLRSHLLLTKRL